MANISEEKWIEMLEKKADGSYIVKYPKIKSKSGVTFDELLANKISAGTGLFGGGDLSSNRELKVNFGTGSTQVARGNHGHNDYLSDERGVGTYEITMTLDEKATKSINVGKFNFLFLSYNRKVLLIDYKNSATMGFSTGSSSAGYKKLPTSIEEERYSRKLIVNSVSSTSINLTFVGDSDIQDNEFKLGWIKL